MARTAIAILALVALLALYRPVDAQRTNTTTTTTTDVVAPISTNTTTTNTTSTNTTAACPLTEAALAGVNLMNASMACADSTTDGFCSDCLCSIATALVAGSPTFQSLASGGSDIDLNTLVEQCAGTLGPALLSALSTESLTALAGCDLNAAAMMCGGNTTQPEPTLVATQGPANPQPVAATPRPASSGAKGVLMSALMAAPLLMAMFLA